ncbi:MAG: hypothetical protein ABSG89_13385 [Bacteroidales bacterium]
MKPSARADPGEAFGSSSTGINEAQNTRHRRKTVPFNEPGSSFHGTGLRAALIKIATQTPSAGIS